MLLVPESDWSPGAQPPSPLAATPEPRKHAASGWLPGAASRGAVAKPLPSPLPAAASPAGPASPSSLRGSRSLGSLGEARVRGRPHYGTTMATHVRHSVPDERCTLGGTESYKVRVGIRVRVRFSPP